MQFIYYLFHMILTTKSDNFSTDCKWMVRVTESDCVLCEVRTEALAYFPS
jgi:hypothetical protein